MNKILPTKSHVLKPHIFQILHRIFFWKENNQAAGFNGVLPSSSWKTVINSIAIACQCGEKPCIIPSSSFRYIAVCCPILHRDLVHTYSVARRVVCYTGPVIVLSILLNIPKFLETKVVLDEEFMQRQDESGETPLNVSVITYSIDVTELR